MLIGLQAGFLDDPIDLDAIKSFGGFDLIRTDLRGLTRDRRLHRVNQILEYGFTPLVIIDNATEMDGLSEGTHVELGNEPDLNGVNFYHYLVKALAAAERRAGRRLWIGAVSNLNERGFNYLGRLSRQLTRFPLDVGISFHRYPNGDSPLVPHTWCRSREHEVNTLRGMIDSRRPFAVSEVGYHTAERKHFWSWLGIKKRWTDQQVAAHMQWERDFWLRMGAEFVVAYQLRDGAGKSALDRYGFRRVDGTWKPVAYAFTGRTREAVPTVQPVRKAG